MTALSDSGSLQTDVPMMNRQVWWFLLFSVMANSSLSLLLSVLPFFASETTGNPIAAGLATGTMMLATVVVQLVTPRLMADLGYRKVMALGIALLGFPSLILIATPSLVVILLVCVGRGAGLAITVVAGTALAAQLFPIHRRAEGLGIFGVAISIPTIFFLPLGLWLADAVGLDLVFIITAISAVAGLAIVGALPSPHPGARPTQSILSELTEPKIVRPTIVFSLSTLAVGILITYLALAVPDDTRNVAAIGLFVQGLCTAVARWAVGRLGDQVGSHRLLAPSMFVAAIGMLFIVATGCAFMVITGMALFGLGFGGSQNASLAILFDHAPRYRFAQVSVIWNLAYDAGMGIGAVGFGLLSRQVEYSLGFLAVAAILFAAFVLSLLDRGPVPSPSLVSRNVPKT